MKTISKLLVLLLFAGACFAAPAPSGESATKHKKAKKESAGAEDVKQLKDMIQAQQAEIDQLKQQMAQHDQQTGAALTDAQKAAADAQAKAAAAQATAASADAKVDGVQTEVGGLKTTVGETVVTVKENEKKVNALDQPAYVHYKGVKLTPGGYAQLATIYRTHNANADTADSYGSFPLSGSANSKVAEWRESGRASRLSLKAEGTVKGMNLLGYWESDFLGAAPTANETQTNSFTPRLRLALGSVTTASGWNIVGGQNWTLDMTTKKGIDPLSEWLPALIDNSYTVGFSYARQGSIRVTKNIGSKAWFGISAENPATVSNVQCQTLAASATPGVATTCNGLITAGVQGTQNSTITTTPTNGFVSGAAPSNNEAPDFVAKIAFEPGWGHYEIRGVARFYKDRVYPNANATGTPAPTAAALVAGANNKVTESGALGFGMVLPIVAKKLDVEFQFVGGKGVGRFGTTGGPDVTIRPDGTLIPLKGMQTILGIEMHPTPKFDFNVYGGDEYYGRTTYAATSVFGSASAARVLGYGAPTNLNGGCNTEGLSLGLGNALQCQSTAQNRNIWGIQTALWYRAYRGKEGTIQLGASYDYTYRKTWSGVGPTVGSSVNPLAIENIVMTSFRYIIP